MYKFLLVSFICIFNAITCTTPLAAQNSVLIVSAAASLRNVMQSAGSLFEKQNQGVKVLFNFASSGILAQQIISGAPVDIFFSADIKDFERFAKSPEILAAGYPQAFLKNSLCFISAVQVKAKLNSIEELTNQKWQKIAVGNFNTVPAGRYAEQTLKAASLYTKLKGCYVLCENVRQVLDYVIRGEVDGGFVYKTDINSVNRDVLGNILVIDETLHEPIIYGVGRINFGQNPALSDSFIAFLKQPEVQQIFIDAGFGLPAISGD